MILKVIGCRGESSEEFCKNCDKMFDFKECTRYRTQNKRSFIEKGRFWHETKD